MQRYAPDLMKDPVHVLMNRLYYVPLILLRYRLVRLWRLAVHVRGCFPASHIGSALHLARKLRDTSVGHSPFHNTR